jgi:hypothetical protein
MGVTYKLKPEVINFILEQKKANPKISCRKLIPLVEKEFPTKVSKSSINFIFKQAGLSLPAGRRARKEKVTPLQPIAEPTPAIVAEAPEAPVEPQASTFVEPQPQIAPLEAVEVPMVVEVASERECPGLILLRAVDSLLGGSRLIAKVIGSKLNIEEKELLSRTEALIYLPLFDLPDKTSHIQELSLLVGKQVAVGDLLAYLNELQELRTINLDISQVIAAIFKDIRCIEVNISDGNTIYLDGQFHTVWSGPYIPYDFSITISNVKSYINKYFTENSPIVLFMAPGYDTPTKEFFTFLSSLISEKNHISGLSFLGNKLEKLENLTLPYVKKRKVVFALWPWQYVEFRKVKNLGEFKPVQISVFNKEFYAAEIEIELLQPQVNQYVTIKGYAVKMSPQEKTRVLILSNFTDEITGPQELMELYLGHWPNFEEGFQDFSRKIELFTYTGASRRFFSSEMLGLDSADMEISTILNRYLEALDLYAKWHFFPSEYSEKEFRVMKEQFYGLKSSLKQGQAFTSIAFRLPPAYQFLRPLEYALRRLNERQIVLADKTRAWFSL